ncbi:uncharacterized protein Tco025E_10257, partial [Trypanosoma conorhini]
MEMLDRGRRVGPPRRCCTLRFYERSRRYMRIYCVRASLPQAPRVGCAEGFWARRGAWLFLQFPFSFLLVRLLLSAWPHVVLAKMVFFFFSCCCRPRAPLLSSSFFFLSSPLLLRVCVRCSRFYGRFSEHRLFPSSARRLRAAAGPPLLPARPAGPGCACVVPLSLIAPPLSSLPSFPPLPRPAPLRRAFWRCLRRGPLAARGRPRGRTPAGDSAAALAGSAPRREGRQEPATSPLPRLGVGFRWRRSGCFLGEAVCG